MKNENPKLHIKLVRKDPPNATQEKPAKSAPRPTPNAAPRQPQKPPAEAQKKQNATQENSLKSRNATQIKKQKPQNATPQKPRRRNEESYNFSRSLSETRERILTERRERLEDAAKFKREDVNQKKLIGIVAFIASAITVALIITIIVSAVLGTEKLKKNRGEYIYNIGKSSEEYAYKDSVRDDLIYINMNSIAELCELTLSGSSDTALRFTAKSGDHVSFTANSATAKINGYSMTMPGPAYFDGTNCSVPLDFLELVLGGISVRTDLKKNEITVTRLEYTDSTPLEPHFVEVSFSLKIDTTLNPLDENKYFKDQPIFSFKNDLSDYEQYMNPSNKEYFLALVNKNNPTPGYEYEPENIIEINDPNKTYWLDSTAAKAVEAMLMEMQAAGFTDIYVTSGYRSYNYQSILYENYVNSEMKNGLSREEAEQKASTYSALPGTSEHHTGLAIDLMQLGGTLDESFADLEVYDWLLANAWKFGFILRYTEDKVDVTGYVFEPWHWRFVGRDTALEILRSGEALEEYLGVE